MSMAPAIGARVHWYSASSGALLLVPVRLPPATPPLHPWDMSVFLPLGFF